MKQHIIACTFLILSLAAGCGPGPPEQVHRLGNYRWDPAVPLPSRVTMPARLVLDHLRKLDGVPGYEGYLPSPEEMKVIQGAISFLPDDLRMILERRCIAIHFIEGFATSGLTEWVLGDDRALYAFMAFNPAALKSTASEILTSREKTCFIPDEPSYDIRIRCGDRLNGFYYILLHEAVHVADYAYQITPFVETATLPYQPRRPDKTEVTGGVWCEYRTPCTPLSFTGKVSFYGLRPPKLRLSRAADTYRELAQSPFASLYGSATWVEDAAELAAFCHITGTRNISYSIDVTKKGQTIMSINPMESARMRKRCLAIKWKLAECNDTH